jgi:pilus assembly protein CpaB
MTYRLRNISIAIALALVAALLTSFYVTSYQRDVRSDETNVPIYVAARDIPAGTSSANATAKGMLKESEIVRRSVVPGAITKPDQLAGLVATQQIFAGEQITTRRFSAPSERGVHAQLTGIQRAVAVPGDEHQLLVGLLKPGDHIDVVASWTYPEGSSFHYTRIILRDILVLRAPQTGPGTTEKLATTKSTAVMVAVTDNQVQKLFWAMKHAVWHFELRPATDAADSPENLESGHSLLIEGVRTKQLQEAGFTDGSTDGVREGGN